MKNHFLSYFYFTKSQRKGLLVLLLLSVGLQITFYFILKNTSSEPEKLSTEAQQWLALQEEINNQKAEQNSTQLKPFNPNFITEYKAHKLGLSTEELKKLHQFRANNLWINSVAQFQEVTGVSDVVLAKISPYFKFPDWVTNSKTTNYITTYPSTKFSEEKIIPIDLNIATVEQLEKVNGIGNATALKIIDLRSKLGAFVSIEQLKFIYGIQDYALEDAQRKLFIKNPQNILKIDINNASIDELKMFPYFNYSIAKQIVKYRSMNGDLHSKTDLQQIPNFPIEKIDIISVYLTF